MNRFRRARYMASRMLESDKARFLIAGVSTTCLSYLTYLALLFGGMKPEPSYIVSYLVGYVWSYLVNSRWVFRAPLSWASFLRYPLVYLVQAIAAFVLFKLLIDATGVPVTLAPLIVVVLTVPLTYLASRVMIRGTLKKGP